MVQTFLDDLANILDWSWQARKILVISGFCFDALFTLEFLIRFFTALTSGKGKLREYFFLRRGWIDLVASIPLLLFNSGPAFFALYTGMVIGGFTGVLNVLKVVKAVRIARILRLLRVLKVFKQIKFADSVMVQRHSARIVTTAVTAVIIPITLMSFLFSFIHMKDLENHYSTSHMESARYLASQHEINSSQQEMQFFCEGQTQFLMVQRGDEILYSRFDQEFYDRYYNASDYAYFEQGTLTFYLDLKPLNRSQSWSNLTIFVTVIILIGFLLIFYGPHFALTVSDPVNIMRKGMTEPGYHLQVAIPDDYQNDDLFRLAKEYNEEYLPLKMRNQEEGSSGIELDMDDLEDLFKI